MRGRLTEAGAGAGRLRLGRLHAQLCSGEEPPPKVLTLEQREHYRTQGYVLVPQVLSADEVADLHKEFADLFARKPKARGGKLDTVGNPIPGPTEHFSFTDTEKGDDPRTYTSKTQVLNRINQMFLFAPAALRTAGNPRLLGLVEDLYGPDFLPFGEAYVVKPPKEGAGWSFHQDTGVAIDFPYPWQPDRGLNLGIYLHDSSPENGCLHVIPGSHKEKEDMDALRSRYGFGGMFPGAIPVPCKAGDVIVHARNVIHGSMPNASPDMRTTLYMSFMPKQAARRLHSEEEVQNRQARIKFLYIPHRVASGRFSGETPYQYRGLQNLQLDRQQAAYLAEGGNRSLLDRSKYPDLAI